MNIYGTINDDAIYGTDSNDRLSGNYGNDSLYGAGGSDKSIGGAGHDVLFDEWGDNILYGGSGNDLLIGTGNLYAGAGNDRLQSSFQGTTNEYGGRGADIFDAFLNAIPEQFIPGTTPTHITFKDFHPSQGDRISLLAQDDLGNWYGQHGFGQLGSMEIFNNNDTNHDGKWTTADTWIHATPDGKGLELPWWGATLTIDNTTAILADWIV